MWQCTIKTMYCQTRYSISSVSISRQCTARLHLFAYSRNIWTITYTNHDLIKTVNSSIQKVKIFIYNLMYTESTKEIMCNISMFSVDRSDVLLRVHICNEKPERSVSARSRPVSSAQGSSTGKTLAINSENIYKGCDSQKEAVKRHATLPQQTRDIRESPSAHHTAEKNSTDNSSWSYFATYIYIYMIPSDRDLHFAAVMKVKATYSMAAKTLF